MLLGLVAIIGVLIIQFQWLSQAFDIEKRKFGEKVHIALLEVVDLLYQNKGQSLPSANPVKQISEDYYIVDINNEFSAPLLEHYMMSTFDKYHVSMDFEYAIYDCETDNMIYGNYVSHDQQKRKVPSSYFPKSDNLVYYFAIRFPNKQHLMGGPLLPWTILSIILFIVLVIYVYSVFVLLQQKRYSALQKDFINNMTHEFKTPLSSILIAAHYLQNHWHNHHQEKRKKYIQLVIEQAHKLNHHIEEILSIAKTETHSSRLHITHINLCNTIKEVSAQMSLTYPHIQIHSDFQTPKIYVMADETHLFSILHNLLENSVKYCRTNPCIDILVRTHEKEILLSIKDNGIGISPRHQKRIFDKFYRIPDKGESMKKGFGLGLFYIKHICDRLGWRISLNSKEGEGTCITLHIPKMIAYEENIVGRR